METFTYCRVCLVTDVKMFSLDSSKHEFGFIYSHLVDIPISSMNQHVCYECVRLIQKYYKFKSKCLRVNQILSEIGIHASTITRSDLERYRHENNLESHLRLTPTELFTYNGIKNNEDDLNNVKTDIDLHTKDNIKAEEIKQEVVILLENNMVSEDTKMGNTDDDEKLDCDESSSDNQNLNSLIDNNDTEELPISQLIQAEKIKRVTSTINKCEQDTNNDKISRKKSKKVVKNRKVKEKILKCSKKEVDLSIFKGFATVVTLTPDEAKQEVILRKGSTKYLNSLFKCDLCYTGFETKPAFDNHMKKHSPEQGDLECEFCQLRFSRKLTMWRHKERHKRKFICNVCPYVCVGIHQAKSHVNLHKGKTYVCNICGDIFRVQNSLCMHKQSKHLMSEFICEHCGQVFGTPRGLTTHLAILHCQDKNDKLGPECKECGVHFASVAAWNKHLVQSSKHNVSNGCKICGENFPNMEELKAHKRVHSRRPKYRPALPTACSICNSWLQKRSEYETHMTSEHPHSDEAKKLCELQKHVCEVCGQVFKKKVHLNYHKNKHTGDRPYKCVECDQSFSHPNLLSVHKSSVHASTRLSCDTCGRLCRTKKSLSAHMKIHRGVRPYKCDSCDKTFFHPCEVKTHTKHAHNNVPWPKKKKKTEAEDT